jgi:hypothetical protein
MLAILLVGSYARGRQRPDSDVDIVVISEEKPALLANLDWVAGLIASDGSPIDGSLEYYGEVTAIRAFQGGVEYEIGVASPRWLSLPLDAGTERTLRDGYAALFERDGALGGVRAIIPEFGS